MIRHLLILFPAVWLAGCSKPAPNPAQSSELIVATRNSPTAYFINEQDQPAGYAYDLISRFAEQHGWKVRWVVSPDLSSLYTLAKQAQVNIVAAELTAKAVKQQGLRPGPPLFISRALVISRQGGPFIAKAGDLVGKNLAVLGEGGHVELLQALQKKVPGLSWAVLAEAWPEELLSRLSDGEFDAVVVNETDYDRARLYYPGLAEAFTLADYQQVVWALPKGTPKDLARQLKDFVAKAEQDGTLRQTFERYYGHIKQLDESDIAGILSRRSVQLPKYSKLFRDAHEKTGIDWRLLAAIGYQESQWNPYATSPTGVKGIMMLTGDTADRLGVTDRLDPRQSILAGARYLVMLKDELPASIPEPDRTWIALAAYNLGMGHLEDARRLTQARTMNPDSWADLKKHLPLLAQGRYARATRYGYARGREAVILVESVRNYYDILTRFEQPLKPPLTLTQNARSLPRTAALKQASAGDPQLRQTFSPP